MIWSKTGMYSRSMPYRCRSRLLYACWNMTVLRCDRARQGRRQAIVFLAALLHRAACDQILKFFIRTQPEHFLSTTRGVTGTEIFVHDEIGRASCRERGEV